MIAKVSDHGQPDVTSLLHQMAPNLREVSPYVDKILRGARPGDLPVEQPSKFDLVVNLKIAKALGLTIPESVLLRAGSGDPVGVLDLRGWLLRAAVVC